MHEFVNLLNLEFKSQADLKIALTQKVYMCNQFEFFGLKIPVRRELQKPFLVKAYLPNKEELNELVK